MIKFVLRNKEERLIDDLPRDRYDLLNNMKGIGISKQLSDIKLSDDEENDCQCQIKNVGKRRRNFAFFCQRIYQFPCSKRRRVKFFL